jgi:hypothetical protein
VRSGNSFTAIERLRMRSGNHFITVNHPHAGSVSDLTPNERPAVGRRLRYKSVGVPEVFLTAHTCFFLKIFPCVEPILRSVMVFSHNTVQSRYFRINLL